MRPRAAKLGRERERVRERKREQKPMNGVSCELEPSPVLGGLKGSLAA